MSPRYDKRDGKSNNDEKHDQAHGPIRNLGKTCVATWTKSQPTIA
jgi:hypothetical protein